MPHVCWASTCHSYNGILILYYLDDQLKVVIIVHLIRKEQITFILSVIIHTTLHVFYLFKYEILPLTSVVTCIYALWSDHLVSTVFVFL